MLTLHNPGLRWDHNLKQKQLQDTAPCCNPCLITGTLYSCPLENSLGWGFSILYPSSKMSSAMTAQPLVKKSCVNLCSLCCSCCNIAKKNSRSKPKDHWVFFQVLCSISPIFFPFHIKEYILKKNDGVRDHEGFQPCFK